MIYITGDTHIPYDVQKLNTKRFPEQKSLTESDYVIICGDFGGVWDGNNEELYWRKWLNNKNFTTLFIDGNHENFDMLKDFSEIEFLGGRAHKISDKIYHLMRGQVFKIDGKIIFTFGGASSHDKEFRVEGRSWWKEELPTDEEFKVALENLEKVDFNVDYVITHCAATSIQILMNSEYETDKLTDFLDDLKGKLKYKKWFFGHYHEDKQIDDKHFAMYNKIKQP